MTLKKIFYFFLAVCMLVINIIADEDQKTQKKENASSLHHEIVITATRIETTTREIASSVTVITKDELNKEKKITIIEALQEVPGLNIIQNGSTGAAASVFLRGANSEHTLVMMDGVELNDPISPSRSFDFAHLALADVERIEILRSPQSTLYGSDALGGVINIITRKGQGKPKLNLTGLGGSYGTFCGSAGISGGTDKINYYLSSYYFQNSGLSAASATYEGNEEKDGYRNLTFSGRFGLHLLDNLDFDFFLKSQNTKTDIDNFGGSYGDDPNNVQDYRSISLRCQTRAILFKNRWEQKLGVSTTKNDRKHNNPTDEFHQLESDTSHYKSRLWKLDWQNNFFLDKSNTLTFGVDYKQERGESEYYSWSFFGNYESIFLPQTSYTAGTYIQDQIRIADKLFATVGVRFDRHKNFGNAITYRIAPAYYVEKTGTKFKATYGTGFKSPSLYQLYAPASLWGEVGNKDLEPEKSSGWEAGIEQQFLNGRLMLETTFFLNNYENLIQFDSIQGYMNIGKAEAKGKEIILKTNPFKKFFINTAFTKTETKDENSDTCLLRRPKHKFSACINYEFNKKYNVHISLIYTGERDDMDFSMWPPSRVKLSPYTIINGVISYNIAQNTQIFFRLDNITNEKYELIKGYGTPSFSAFMGIRLQIQ